MNLNKINLYKSSKYFLIVNGVISVIGIIVAVIFGFNFNTTIMPGTLLFNSVLSIIISLALILIYIGIRYDFAKAFSMIIVSAHNVILSTALLAILRIGVSESIIMGYILTVVLTCVFMLMITEKLNDVNLKKADYNALIKSTLKANIKAVVIVFSVVLVILLLGLIISSESMFGLVRIFLVMLAVIIYSLLTIMLPIWCFFSSKIKKVKKVKVDENIDNQKVIKAVTVDNEEVGEAVINNEDAAASK